MYKVYGKTVCPNCDVAKGLLKNKGEEYEFINVEEDDVARAKLEWYGFRSVPVIFKGDAYLGGLEDLKKDLT